jgi:co-chaperonin GroES (HSP10)
MADANARDLSPDNTSLSSRGTFDLGDLKFWALGDRVLIQEDEFKTGYECMQCGGSGKAPCGDCEGRGEHLRAGVARKCSHCENGAVTCPECNGKGGLIVAPEIAERRPTTGKVVSVGDKCHTLKVGDSVMYSNFAGYVVDLQAAGRPVVLRILHETEVLCGMSGQLQLRNYRGKNEITQYAS